MLTRPQIREAVESAVAEFEVMGRGTPGTPLVDLVVEAVARAQATAEDATASRAAKARADVRRGFFPAGE